MDSAECRRKQSLKYPQKYYRTTIDQKILDAYDSNPKYFNKLYFQVRSSVGTCVGMNINVPTQRQNAFTPSDTNQKITGLASEIIEIYEMIYKAKESLRSHLISLRTFEKIKEQFPEVTIEQKGKTMELSLITPDLLAWIKK